MQSKQELEKWHSTKDAWGYETNSCDAKRKEIILSYLSKYKRALDIGAGEGWVTTSLPAAEIHAIEIADNAAKRFPSNVKRVFEPEGEYDLVMTTGTLYDQYNKQQIFDWIKKSASKHILIAGIKDWLPPLPKPDKYTEFKYREYTQVIYFYETTPQCWK